MSTAQKLFKERMLAIETTLSQEVLRSKGIGRDDENTIAQVLRNGLCISLFVILEDFIKGRGNEILKTISSNNAKYSQLSPQLQAMGSTGVVKALQYQIGAVIQDSAVKLNEVRLQGEFLRNIGGPNYEFSDYSFGKSKSNISHADIDDFLGALRVKDPWNSIKYLADQIGIMFLDAKEAFLEISSSRHSAAHDPKASIEITDLEKIHNNAIGIAFAFDVMATHSVSLINKRDPKVLDGQRTRIIEVGSIGFRFVEKGPDGKWREKTVGARRASSVGVKLNDVVSKAHERAKKNGEIVVIKDQQGKLSSWLS